jgi:resolvase-like protein
VWELLRCRRNYQDIIEKLVDHLPPRRTLGSVAGLQLQEALDLSFDPSGRTSPIYAPGQVCAVEKRFPQLDTSTPAGKLVFTVLGAVAELERSLIVERVRAGMRNARAKGKLIGRPAKTQLDQNARRSIWEAHKRGGMSLRQLATQFSTSLGTVQRCIQTYQPFFE